MVTLSGNRDMFNNSVSSVDELILLKLLIVLMAPIAAPMLFGLLIPSWKFAPNICFAPDNGITLSESIPPGPNKLLWAPPSMLKGLGNYHKVHRRML